ncbi:MAG: type II toxin-antitoxin system VapC family toxin [Anaerolineae bacterium]
MSERLVIDASFAFRLILPGPHQERYRALAAQWHREDYLLCTPTLWIYEITSAFCKVAAFGQIGRDQGRQALALAQKLGVRLFPPDDTQTRLAFDWTMRLKRAAAYDSFYLALAETLQSEFWTADKGLSNAADVSWIHLVDESL